MRGLARFAPLVFAISLPATAQETAPARPAPKPEAALAAGPDAAPTNPEQTGATTTTDAVLPAPEQRSETPPNRPVLAEDDFTHSACLLTLYTLGTNYAELPAITEPDQPGCGIARPIKVSAILPGLTISGDAVMRCETARQLALWSRDHLQPAAAFLPGPARLTVIKPGSTYQCRDVVGNGDGTDLSEHATGNAFDIMAFGFADGSRLEIAPRQDSGDMAEAFQTAIRGAACLYFTTVLGPGANAAHDNHLHFDIKPRNGGWRLCQ